MTLGSTRIAHADGEATLEIDDRHVSDFACGDVHAARIISCDDVAATDPQQLNLILSSFPDDFRLRNEVRLTGRRLAHVTSVHRAAVGDSLTVGVAGGGIGTGEVTRLDATRWRCTSRSTAIRRRRSPLTLVLALPRPKVLNRVIAGATSLGVKRIFLINAWRVEKSYWKSPRLSDENLLLQRILGLEQARDTMLPAIELRRLFRPFVEDELPSIIAGDRCARRPSRRDAECPRDVREPVTLAIGPEGGFIARGDRVARAHRLRRRCPSASASCASRPRCRVRACIADRHAPLSAARCLPPIRMPCSIRIQCSAPRSSSSSNSSPSSSPRIC